MVGFEDEVLIDYIINMLESPPEASCFNLAASVLLTPQTGQAKPQGHADQHYWFSAAKERPRVYEGALDAARLGPDCVLIILLFKIGTG